MRKRILVAALAVGCGLTGPGARGQMAAGASHAAQAGAPADPAKAYDALLSMFQEEFMGAARAMPADKYDFTPASLNIPGASYTGVRTFAEQVKHVTQANYSIYSAVGGMKPDVNVKAIGQLKFRDEILAALAASFTYAHKAIATLTPQNAFDVVKGPGLQTRGSLAGYGVAHGFDHYGQMVEYLRMNGIVPPASAK